MNTRALAAFLAAPLAAGLALPAGARVERTLNRTITRVTAMPGDQELLGRARGMGLDVLNVLWEDTARAAGSSLGPNISDVTLQVHEPLSGGGKRQHLLPVIRFPNFTDETADVPAESLFVRVGNHGRAGSLEPVPLTEVLGNLRRYLSDPSSLVGDDDFLARRDTHFLVSAQHVFLPIPEEGQVEFNPVIFNYQSSPGDPAVLVLLITREGTSVQVVENRQGQGGRGQPLFFNNSGQRTLFTAERRSAVEARIEQHGVTEPGDVGALEEGSDMMLIVQVPLKHNNRGVLGGLAVQEGAAPMAAPSMSRRSIRREQSDVEQAVLGHGDDLGPFVEANNLRLERDDRFPIRVTVQFYRATSNGVIDDSDLRAVRDEIRMVYDNADYVGSLVVPDTPRHRPTDWIRDRPEEAETWSHIPDSWSPFLPRPRPGPAKK
ncbi:MAG: hypothetical protein ACOC0J_00310 [Myxococcota bacterium]